MKRSAEITALETRIGHRFARPELLRRAVTHSSMSGPGREDNQRLEFLGDRVLGLVMAEALLAGDRVASEGQLAPRFNTLVRKEACAEVAQAIDLGAALKLGRSEMMSGGRRKQALLGDAMEAVIAAVYLDAGFDAARAVILRLWGDRVAAVDTDARDPKTALQEWAHQRGPETPNYEVIDRSGPDHNPSFTIRVHVDGVEPSEGEGRSKRLAEQAAATAMLIREKVWKDEGS